MGKNSTRSKLVERKKPLVAVHTRSRPRICKFSLSAHCGGVAWPKMSVGPSGPSFDSSMLKTSLERFATDGNGAGLPESCKRRRGVDPSGYHWSLVALQVRSKNLCAVCVNIDVADSRIVPWTFLREGKSKVSSCTWMLLVLNAVEGGL